MWIMFYMNKNSEYIGIRISKKVKDDLEKKAKMQDRSLSSYIRQLLTKRKEKK